MIEIITEANQLVSRGSIVQLKWETFDGHGNDLIQSRHMFLVISTVPLTVAPLSSQMRHVKPSIPFHVPIKDYTSAGLVKPSYVNLGTRGTISMSDIYKIVGHISHEDMEAVLKAIVSAPLEKLLEYTSNLS